jgi:hypothetical protein
MITANHLPLDSKASESLLLETEILFKNLNAADNHRWGNREDAAFSGEPPNSSGHSKRKSDDCFYRLANPENYSIMEWCVRYQLH